jgi:anti-anti-sigma factor
VFSRMNPNGPVRIHVEYDLPVLTIWLSGELDLEGQGTANLLHELDMQGVSEVVVDLAQLRFVDTAGAISLLGYRDHLAASGRDVRLVGMTPLVQRVIAWVSEN